MSAINGPWLAAAAAEHMMGTASVKAMLARQVIEASTQSFRDEGNEEYAAKCERLLSADQDTLAALYDIMRAQDQSHDH